MHCHTFPAIGNQLYRQQLWSQNKFILLHCHQVQWTLYIFSNAWRWNLVSTRNIKQAVTAWGPTAKNWANLSQNLQLFGILELACRTGQRWPCPLVRQESLTHGSLLVYCGTSLHTRNISDHICKHLKQCMNTPRSQSPNTGLWSWYHGWLSATDISGASQAKS